MRASAPAAATATPAVPTARFEAATAPCRLVDVRSGVGYHAVDDNTVTVAVRGRCEIPADATSVALTVTVDASRVPLPGFVSISPAVLPANTTDRTSVINHAPGEVRANGTIVGIGADGKIAVFSLAPAPAILDVTGWFVPATTSTGGRFVAIAPTRAIDTRQAPRAAPLAAGETLTVPLPPGVPADASAVAITVTATESRAPGFVSVAPTGVDEIATSAVNTDRPLQTRASGTIVGVTPAGIDVFSLNGGHVIIDVTGWFTPETAPDSGDGLFVAEPVPRRLLDTRRGDPLWRDTRVEIANVAPNASALALNVTIVSPFTPGFVTAHPARLAMPPTSTVNGPTTTEVAAALSVVPASTAGVALFSSGGADVLADLFGWFTGAPQVATDPAPNRFRPPECAPSSDPAGLTDFFAGSAAFRGADYQRAFPLPDGRILWVFQDVYIRGRGGSSTFVHNAALVQGSSCFSVLYSGNFAAPRDFLFADATERERRWFWPMAGEMGADGLFHLFVAEMRERGPTYLSKTEPVATWRVALDPSTMAVVSRQLASNPSPSLYGWSIASSDDFTYLYAHCHRQFGWDAFPFVDPPVFVHDFSCVQQMYVARIPKGRFDLPLSYWDGSGWVANPASAANIAPPGRLVSASQIYRTAPGKYVAITKVGDWFGETIEIDIASAPQGPFRTVRTIATGRRCSDCNTYFPSKLPYNATNGQWIIGLSNNRFGPVDLSRYDPTFFSIDPV